MADQLGRLGLQFAAAGLLEGLLGRPLALDEPVDGLGDVLGLGPQQGGSLGQ